MAAVAGVAWARPRLLHAAGRGRRPWQACAAALLFLAAGASAGRETQGDDIDLPALRREARSYEHGEGVGRDPSRAIALYCQAARRGDAESQYSLGWIYANGRGVARDDGLAAYFFKLAAEQGHVHANTMLSFVGNPAIGVPECMREAEAVADTAPSVEAPEQFSDAAPKFVQELVSRLAPQYGVHPGLAMAVISAESNFNSVAVSAKNAQGLMQLIPSTSARFKVGKPFDPEQNIRGGLAYLRWLLAYFKGNVALVAAAYNAGEGAVNRFRGIPPYAETKNYVRRIMAMFRQDAHPYDPSVTDPSPELGRIRIEKAL